MRLENFKILLDCRFWIKSASIGWWGLVVGSYVWFLGFVGRASLLDGWLSVVAATLIGGAGMNHLSKLYDKHFTEFNGFYLLPAGFISVGAAVLVIGALILSLNEELWAQCFGIVYTLIAVFAIVGGADTAPKSESNS